MATTYDATPSILERAIAADIIAVGTLRGPTRTEPVPDDEPGRMYGWFEATLDEVLDGDPPASEISIRVIGDRDGKLWPVAAGKDLAAVMFLQQDVGPDLPHDLFAPCFNGIYALSADGRVNVPRDSIDADTRNLAGSDEDGLSIEVLRQIIESIHKRHDATAMQLDEFEPTSVRELRRDPLDERVTDTTDTYAAPGGGQPAEVAKPPEDSENSENSADSGG